MVWDNISSSAWDELKNFNWGELRFCNYEALINPQNSEASLPPEAKTSLINLRNELSAKNPSHKKILMPLGINSVKDLIEFILSCYALYQIANDIDLINRLMSICDMVCKSL